MQQQKKNKPTPFLFIVPVIVIFVALFFLFNAGGGNNEANVITIGVVFPLTGDAADSFGIASKNVVEVAVADVNERWAEQGRRLEVVFADGKCNPDDALAAAQQLVAQYQVNVIVGGACSGETLGIAPFAEENNILVFSPLSTSNEITTAGEFIFRNIPRNGQAVSPLATFLREQSYSRVAVLTENTSYAQDLRSILLQELDDANIALVADQVTPATPSNVSQQVSAILNADPDAVVLFPQTIAAAGLFSRTLDEQGFEEQGLGNENLVIADALSQYGAYLEGFVAPSFSFATEGTPAFAQLEEQAPCNTGYYCATTYDSIALLAELMESCGDDAVCLRDSLYQTQNWEGPFYGNISFDRNGDIGGTYTLVRVVDGTLQQVE